MPIKLDSIIEAQTDTKHTVFIPFQVSNGDGSPHEEKLKVVYRPLTDEVVSVKGVAAQLAAVIIEWDADEPPTLEVLRARPIPFLNHISEAIAGDFFRERRSS